MARSYEMTPQELSDMDRRTGRYGEDRHTQKFIRHDYDYERRDKIIEYAKGIFKQLSDGEERLFIERQNAMNGIEGEQ